MSSSEEKPEIVVDEKRLQYNIDGNALEDDSNLVLHNGEPIITTGNDVSRFVVDIRDDEDRALTFRSMFLGTIFAGMGAALSQVSNFKNLDNDRSDAIRSILTISGRYTCTNQCRCQSPPSSCCS